jgi:acylphosphatase
MKQSVKIVVKGVVQGVFYRVFAQKQAEQFGIEGTAQNSDNGSVVIYASGFSEKLDEFIDSLYQGSSKSTVQDVIVEPLLTKKDFRGVFRVIGSN